MANKVELKTKYLSGFENFFLALEQPALPVAKLHCMNIAPRIYGQMCSTASQQEQRLLFIGSVASKIAFRAAVATLLDKIHIFYNLRSTIFNYS